MTSVAVVAVVAVTLALALVAAAGWWLAIRAERLLIDLTAEVRLLRRRLESGPES